MNDKIVINLSHGNQTLWPVYITIGNLNTKTWQSQKRLGNLLLDSITIIYEWSEDANNKDKNLKAKIYHMALKIMLQCIYPGIFSKKIRQ